MALLYLKGLFDAKGGPSLKIELNERIAVNGGGLFPAHQDLGGAHQELDYLWNASAKISW